MVARPVWQGHLKLSLVTCPVALYAATSPGRDVHFHLLNPETHNRIRMIATDPDTGPVERSRLVRGFEYERNRYVLLSDEEIRAVRIESTRTIDVERFVDAADIDRLYWNDPYYLAPDGKLALEAYAVIRTAMRSTDRLALGRVVMHTRERLVALEPRGEGILAYTLRTFDEIRAPETVFGPLPEMRPDPAMVSIAEKIIDQLSGPFEPESFRDRYEDALHDLIAAKLDGRKTIEAPEPEDAPHGDLMELLRRSLEHDQFPSRRRATGTGTGLGAKTKRDTDPERRQADTGRRRRP